MTARIASLLLSILLLTLLILPPQIAHAESADYDIANGHFYTQAGGGGGRGFAITDDGSDSKSQTVRFWSAFTRLGGVTNLGYPSSRRFTLNDGFIYQATQASLLQWRPDFNTVLLANTFDLLTQAGQNDQLLLKGIPLPVNDDGAGGDYAKAKQIRLGWLTNDLIRAKFYANPNPKVFPNWTVDQSINLYGLPASQPQRFGPFLAQRFQRITFQLWLENVPGMPPAGSITPVLGGDLLKEAGLIPADAAEPQSSAPVRSGRLAYIYKGDVWLANADGSNKVQLTQDGRASGPLSWSADGKALAYLRYSDDSWEIYLVSISTGTTRRLTNNSAFDGNPAFSPDGGRIYFSSDRDKAPCQRLFVMLTDGSGQAQVSNGWDLTPGWSPNGTHMAFARGAYNCSQQTQLPGIYTTNASGTELLRVTSETTDLYPTWSPDSSMLAFESRRDGKSQIYRVNANGTGLVRLTQTTTNESMPSWAPDGRSIAFVSTRDNTPVIYLTNTDGSQTIKLFEGEYPAWAK